MPVNKPTKISQVIASIEAKTRSGETLEPHELEQKRKMELLARVRVMRENSVRDRGKVRKGDPTMSYCWVNQDTRRQVEFKSYGYEICRDPNVETRPEYKQADGTHRRGDQILYQVPKDFKEALDYDDASRGFEMLEAPRQRFIEQLSKEEGASYYQPR
jgi:hypothetical protein